MRAWELPELDPLAPPVRLEIPAKLLPVWKKPRRFNVIHGGRGSAKSRTIARILVMKALRPRFVAGEEKPFRCLCTREIQKSMKDSVHRLIADEIARLGLGDHFDVLETEIRGPNGALFLFAGLQGHTVESIKSYEDLTDVWVEEASSVGDRSWEILIPTLRGKGSCFYITFNPDTEEDAVWQRFVISPPPAHRILRIECNFTDNPWFEDTELVEESAELREKFPAVWQHVYGGQLRSIDGLIFKRTWLRFYDPATETPTGMTLYGSSDYAVTPDGGDYTEMGIFGQDHRARTYVLDWWFGQAEPHDWVDAQGQEQKGWVDAWLDLVEKWRPLYWFEEKGPILSSVQGSMNTAMMARAAEGRSSFVIRHPLASVGSKANRAKGINTRNPSSADAARALGFAGRMSAGAVYLPHPSPERPWVARLISQLMAFHGQGGQVDDGVDVCALFARGLDDVFLGQPPKPDPEAAPKPFTAAWFAARDKMRSQVPDNDGFYR